MKDQLSEEQHGWRGLLQAEEHQNMSEASVPLVHVKNLLLCFTEADQDHPNWTKQLGDQKDHLGVVRSSGAAQTHQRKHQSLPPA